VSGYPDVDQMFGPYRITGELGRGGMGVVYAAVHDGLNRKVAVKVLAPELAKEPSFRRRFEREASALASLYSPHIIDIYDHGERDGCLFIATPLVTGGSLSALLEEHGALPPDVALHVVAQVGAALADAHGAGIVHRDVKPSNVLLHRSADRELFAYLGDFGIATSQDQDRTRTEGIVGTLAYGAPELHRGEEASFATDLYSLGCLLLAALTGRPPYQGPDVEVALQHLHAPVPRYDGGGPAHQLINDVLQRAMAKRPEDRYASAGEMRTDLLRAQQLSVGEPAAATPAGTVAVLAGRRPPTPARRRPARVWAWAAAVVLLAVAAFAGVRAVNGDGEEGAGGADRDGRTAGRLVTCWNGARVARRGDCTPPKGLAGLRWVFPSLDRDFESCSRRLDVTPDPSLQSWWCLVKGGGPGEGISYSEWTEPGAARRMYGEQYGTPALNFLVEGRPVGHRWIRSEPTGSGFFKVSVTYLNLPFSSSLYSRSEEGLDRLCGALLVRSLRSFEAVPTDCTGSLRR
jgi:serine/threonine-protein kinase